jgi:hypothetical protein
MSRYLPGISGTSVVAVRGATRSSLVVGPVKGRRRIKVIRGRTNGPVFATRDGGELDAANIRREFRASSEPPG